MKTKISPIGKKTRDGIIGGGGAKYANKEGSKIYAHKFLNVILII